MFKFFWPVFLLTLWPLAAADLYVWQRMHTPELASEVSRFYRQNSGKLAFWAGEIENDGTVNSIAPSGMVESKRATAVIRIHVRQLQNPPAQLAGKIVKIYQPWQQCNALQIDLDAPESKLDYYCQLMRELRRRLPGTTLSATVLPCHIKHTRSFRLLAQSCDYYVLQIHGLDKRNGKWFIMDETIARTAVARAEKLRFPYQLALPLYAHKLKNGQIIQPDLKLTAELAAQCKNVIGFRLGIKGEREALTLESALDICQGRYTPQIKLYWELQKNGSWVLKIANSGYFVRPVEFTFELPENVPVHDMDTFGAAHLDYDRRQVKLLLPPDGTVQSIMWLRTGKNIDLSQVNTFNITMKEQ